MERIARRWSAVALCALGVLGGLLAASAALARGETTPNGTVVEVTGIEVLPDGRVLQATVLVDAAIADPDESLAAVAPNAVALEPGDVGAQYAINSKWHTSDIPVVVRYNHVADPPGLGGLESVLWAIDAWNSVPNSYFRFTYGGTTSAYASDVCSAVFADGINSVRFSSGLAAGTLGVACSIRGGAPVDGTWRVGEFDLLLDAGTNWSTSDVTPWNAYDLKSTVLHELGHALGLGHSNVPGSTMLPYLGRGSQQRTVTLDDIRGVQALYGIAGAPTPTNTATPTATPPRAVPSHQVWLPALARDESGAAPPPPPTATPTPTRTAAPPTPTPTSTPTQPPAAVSEVYDPDEPEVTLNDIRYVRVSVGDGVLEAYLQAWSPSGFSFFENARGDRSYVAMSFYFGSTGIGDNDLHVRTLAGGVFYVFRTTGDDFTQIHEGTWTDTGDGMRLQLPLALFPAGRNVAWDAFGAQALAVPRCGEGGCAWMNYDWAPDILQTKPRIQLP